MAGAAKHGQKLRAREQRLARAYVVLAGLALALCSVLIVLGASGGVGIVLVLAATAEVPIGWALTTCYSEPRPYYRFKWALSPIVFPSEMIIRSGWPEGYVLGALAVLTAGLAASIIWA